MLALDNGLEKLHHEALQRRARQRLDMLDEMRGALEAKAKGLTQREIAELLASNQPRIHRLLKMAERLSDPQHADPEEIILRAFVDDTDRKQLVRTLQEFPYTFGVQAPAPEEGRLPGTWDQVLSAVLQGLLTEDEFEGIRAHVESDNDS